MSARITTSEWQAELLRLDQQAAIADIEAKAAPAAVPPPSLSSLSAMEWAKALKCQHENTPGVYTTVELAAALGLAKRTMGRRIARALRDGTLVKARKLIVGSRGQRCEVAAYRIVPEFPKQENAANRKLNDG